MADKLLRTKEALKKLGIKDSRTLKKYLSLYKIKRVEFSPRNIKYKEKDINKLIDILEKKVI